MSAVRAGMKLSGFVLLSLFLAPIQAVVCLFASRSGRSVYILPLFYHKVLCRLFGLRLTVCGEPILDGPVLYVANHLSYFDILALSGVIPASFVAKKEVASWPLFGILARLQKTVFIDRSRTAARLSGRQVQEALTQGRPLVLFAEGTSSDGRRVLPFRSSLLAPLDGLPSTRVQPVTVCLEGAVTQAQRDAYAWYGDMDLLPHLWAFAKSSGAHVRLVFHAPLPAGLLDRKVLTHNVQEAVESGLDSGLHSQACVDRPLQRVSSSC